MRWWWMSIAVACLTGCAGYQLGPTNGVPAGAKSVQFQSFYNRTQEPRVVEYLNNSLRKVLQQDGTYRLETAGKPDILVTGEITRLNRSGLSYDPNDVLTPQEYTLSMTARIRAVDTHTGKEFINRAVSGFTFIRVGNDEFSSERQSIPLLTDILARDTVSLLVDGQW